MTTASIVGSTRTSQGSSRALVRRTLDRNDPSLFDAIERDPVSAIDPAVRTLLARDLGRATRLYVYPVVRVLVKMFIFSVILLKRIIPFRLQSHAALSAWTNWFSRRFAGPEAQTFMLRHFIIESQLVNFVARNASQGRVPEVDLLPTSIEQLGDFKGQNAVALHDANVMNLFIDLGDTPDIDVERRRELHELDFSMLEIPELTIHTTGQWVNFDLPTVIYVSAALIAVFFDDRTIERAVNSFQLDESLLAAIANMTGLESLRALTPLKFTHWVGTTGDAPRDLHWHMLVHEQAYGQLLRLKAQAERSAAA
jgi:AraC-like DNA-binding protein